jgi:hypothetical protein
MESKANIPAVNNEKYLFFIDPLSYLLWGDNDNIPDYRTGNPAHSDVCWQDQSDRCVHDKKYIQILYNY